jgi:type II secretory pathway pseudopilin PulG
MRRARAFSLVELMLAVLVGLLLAGMATRLVLATARDSERLALLVRERTFQRRVLALMRAELESAQAWWRDTGEEAECGLGGRTPVLQVLVDGRRITYSLGEAPSGIWRGRVLMRCGPAYGLLGELSGGTAQNRVVLDGMAAGGLRVEEEGPGVVRLTLRQALPLRGGAPLPVRQELRAAVISP